MAREITVNGRKKLSTLQKEFSEVFNYLFIAFIDIAYKDKKGIIYQIDCSKSISEVRTKVSNKELSLNGRTLIKNIEKYFESELGIYCQIGVHNYQGNTLYIPTDDAFNNSGLTAANKLAVENGCSAIGKLNLSGEVLLGDAAPNSTAPKVEKEEDKAKKEAEEKAKKDAEAKAKKDAEANSKKVSSEINKKEIFNFENICSKINQAYSLGCKITDFDSDAWNNKIIENCIFDIELSDMICSLKLNELEYIYENLDKRSKTSKESIKDIKKTIKEYEKKYKIFPEGQYNALNAYTFLINSYSGALKILNKEIKKRK